MKYFSFSGFCSFGCIRAGALGRGYDTVQQVGVGCPELRPVLVEGEAQRSFSLPVIKAVQRALLAVLVQQSGERLRAVRPVLLQTVDQRFRDDKEPAPNSTVQ